MSILESLNEQQRAAVAYDETGMLILAGAGTGKTRVLTSKIAYLINERRVSPGSILAVTFTNKAATEMKNRVGDMLTVPLKGLMLGTFHSICHRLLRIHADAVGLNKNFQILDAADQLSFIKRLLREREVNDKQYPPHEVRSYITAAKEKGLRADAVPKYDDRTRAMAQMYQWYEDACREAHKVDFSELMLSAIDLLRANADLRQHYAARFNYILVDEFQDTNRQQFELLQLLDSGANKFIAVGDDDQSIYAFRGAEPNIMKEFQSTLRAKKLIRLEQNYRSVKNILDMANGLIKNNKNRLGKNLMTAADTGARIEIIRTETGEDEARSVAQMIVHHIKTGENADEMAILYRVNAQGRLFEQTLTYYGVPFKVHGASPFYSRMEVKHVLAFLRLITADDRDALLRVINVPPRGVGEKMLAGLMSGDLFHNFYNSAHKGASKVAEMLTRLRENRPDTLAATVRAIIEETDMLGYYEEKRQLERVENLQELVSAAAQFEENHTQEDGAPDILLSFLSTVALHAGDENDDSDANRRVNLMTVHAAKGLEFNRVFIVGLEEAIFPHAQSISPDSPRYALEEERRLMYVAITRARKDLSLHFALTRTLYGDLKVNKPSRFLSELPEACIENDSWRAPAGGAMRGIYTSRDVAGVAYDQTMTPPLPKLRAGNDAGNGGEAYRGGDAVRHVKYGYGVVIRRHGSGSDAELEIHFKKSGVKKFKAALAKLERL